MSSATNTRLSEIHKDRGLGTRTVLQCTVLALPRNERHEQVTPHHSRLGGGGARPHGRGRFGRLDYDHQSRTSRTALSTESISRGRQRDLDKAQAAERAPIYRRGQLHQRRRRHGRRHRRLRRQRREVAEVHRRSPAASRSSTRRGQNFSNDETIAVSDSFPGRMDWTTGTPQAEPARRLGRPLGNGPSRPTTSTSGHSACPVGQHEGPDPTSTTDRSVPRHFIYDPLPRLRPGQRQVRTVLPVRRGLRGRCWRRTGRPRPARRRRDGRRH